MKEENSAICDNMNQPGGYYAEWDKLSYFKEFIGLQKITSVIPIAHPETHRRANNVNCLVKDIFWEGNWLLVVFVLLIPGRE